MRLQTLENRAFLFLVLLTSAVFFWIVSDFLMTVFWAAVLAVFFRPVDRMWRRRIGGRPTWAALLTTLTVLFVILVPFSFLAVAVTGQAINLYERVDSGEIDVQAGIDWVERQTPALSGLLERYGVDVAEIQNGLQEAAVTASQFIATQALAIGQGTLTFAILFVLTLYFLFFFVRDGDLILDWIVRAVPLGDARERRLFAKFAEVSRATIKGTFVVAVVQGGLGGLLFALVGLDAAVFWGAVMSVLSLLPAIGPALVWGPAAIILIATGSVFKGIVLILGGTLLVGLADNVLRPILVGRDTRMPDYLVLLSTLGGLAVYGLAGVVIGPLVAAFFLVVWQMMAEEYGPHDQATPPVPTPPPAAEAPPPPVAEPALPPAPEAAPEAALEAAGLEPTADPALQPETVPRVEPTPSPEAFPPPENEADAPFPGPTAPHSTSDSGPEREAPTSISPAPGS